MTQIALQSTLQFKSVRQINRGSTGFTYLGLLFAVVIISLALVLGSEVWSTNRQREKEMELLFIGHQFRDAIGRYYEQSPFGDKTFPHSLEELIQDPRMPGVRRYLRRIYEDPMTGKSEWGLVMSDHGGIQGVYSLSGEHAIKTSNFDEIDRDFDGKANYRDWKFDYVPNSVLAAPITGEGGEVVMDNDGNTPPPEPQE